ncbi:MAG: hypothetical protein A2Y10_06430 [Planctomycetes bacterium GWF2_41_51]|nr:MAG: hypothetical protein A2Y10_06430 [Planctomycetes bacterium GWF2_41_51]HBG26407.1 hypothetical protein [Phycisphaerales bacterium]
MFSEHTSIITPKESAVVWRYMPMDKFLFLVTTSKLYFCRSDRFKDPWEGTWPKQIIDSMRSDEVLQQNSENKDALLRLSDAFKNIIYLNCWYCGSHQSAAMWELYGMSGASIAIKSTIEKLKKGILCKENVYIGKVEYIDYEKDTLHELNSLLPYFIKRKSFEHEQEVRILMIDIPEAGTRIDKNLKEGVLVNIDFKTLIDVVYISPSAPKWLKNTIQIILNTFGYGEILVKESELYAPHNY